MVHGNDGTSMPWNDTAQLDYLKAEVREAVIQTILHVARNFPVSRPAISRHLRILRQAGLVRERRQAQSRIYSLEPQPLAEVAQWVARYRVFWGARLHDLKRYVEEESS
jgi:DNA-binding transcriptional ArsR family regulator